MNTGQGPKPIPNPVAQEVKLLRDEVRSIRRMLLGVLIVAGTIGLLLLMGECRRQVDEFERMLGWLEPDAAPSPPSDFAAQPVRSAA